MFLLFFIGFLIGPVLVFLRFHIPGIAATEGTDMVILQINDSCSCTVQEIAVMGNHEDAAFVGAKVLLQPFQHAHVQMVRRFIEKEKIGMTHKSSGQVDSDLLPAGEGMDIPVPVIIGKAQACQNFPGSGFIVVASQKFKAGFRTAIGFHQFFIAFTAFQLPGQSLHPVFVIEHILPGVFHFLPDRMAGIVEILAEVADNGAITGFHGALVRFLRSHNALQKSGLAGAIGTYKADSFAAPYFKGNIFKNCFDSKGF